MKQNNLLLAALLLSLNSIIIKADAAKPDAPKTVVKAQDATPLKAGDKLKLSEFTKTNSGIMFKIIKKGTGDKPLFGETVKVHYTGYLLKNTDTVGYKFDSSVDKGVPFQFKLGARQVIAGWEISLADMKVGEERIVILPSKQAYGSRTTSTIPADSTLIFEIKLIQAS